MCDWYRHFKIATLRSPLSPISAFFNFRKRYVLIFETEENRVRPLPQLGSRRWKIKYLVPVERPETSWNWSNIQSLRRVRARQDAPLIPAEKDVLSPTKNYWQYADKVRLQSYYVAAFFTRTPNLSYDLSLRKVPHEILLKRCCLAYSSRLIFSPRI